MSPRGPDANTAGEASSRQRLSNSSNDAWPPPPPAVGTRKATNHLKRQLLLHAATRVAVIGPGPCYRVFRFLRSRGGGRSLDDWPIVLRRVSTHPAGDVVKPLYQDVFG